MQTFVIVILALFIAGMLSQYPLVAVVLAGLLAMITRTMSISSKLQKRIEQLESQLAGDEPVEAEKPAQANQQVEVKKSVSFTQPPLASRFEKRTARPPQASSTAEAPSQPAPAAAAQTATSLERQATEKAPSQTAYYRTLASRKAQPRQKARAKGSGEFATNGLTVPPVVTAFCNKLLHSAWDWFTGGNPFVRVGIVILFMGMAFLVQHAMGQNMIPIAVRLAAVAAAAIGLLYWGWRQRTVRRNFALVIQGGGIGLLYLTIFASFSLYGVIPFPAAFALLALIVVFAAVLAILQDARSLALFATACGFLAPVLTATGSNNYIGLFSYFAFLNLGIFAIAWFKSWRLLNLVGFVFTFALSTLWGVLSYEPAFYATTQPFLILFFLLYVAISILFANRREAFYKDYVDGTLVFGTPLLAFGLQCAMVKSYEYGVAISAAVLGVFYVLLTQFIWSRYRESLKLLAETFLCLGVIFLTLAIPFAIDGTLTGAIWAIEGAGILWISIRQQQRYRRLFGQALVVAAGLIMGHEHIEHLFQASQFDHAFLNSAFIGCVIIALAASVCGWLLSRPFAGKMPFETHIGHGLLGSGLLVLLLGFEYQIFVFDLLRTHGSLLAILAAVAALLYTLAGNQLRWYQAHWVGVSFAVPMTFATLLCVVYQPQLAAYYGYIIWPLAMLVYFYTLKSALTTVHRNVLNAAHGLWALMLVTLLFWEGLWQLMLGCTLLTIAFNVAANKWQWPQLKIMALGFLPVLVLVALVAVFMDGDLISLSSIASNVTWPFAPGFVLWPMAFAAYFYVLHQTPTINGRSTTRLHYGGAGLIGAIFLWLGLWPLLLAASLLSLLCCYLWQRLAWLQMRTTAMALLPVMLLVALWMFTGYLAPFDLTAFNVEFTPAFQVGYLLWPLAFTVLFWSYRQFDNQSLPASPLFHCVAVLLFIGLLTWQASWHLLNHVNYMNGWHVALLPVAVLLAFRFIMQPPCWPFTTHFEDYRRYALAPMALVLMGWSLLQLFSPGNSAPLPWLPLLNPMAIVQAIVVMVAFLWFGKAFSILANPPPVRVIQIGVFAFVFVWANTELLRGVHHWGGVAWQWPTIVTADISQMVLSLFWALCGLATTVYAGRKAERYLWLVGAALLGVVILKLFLIDLSASGTVERIVSFTGVGLLLVLVGYFSPLPPSSKDTQSKGPAPEQAPIVAPATETPIEGAAP